MRISTIQPLTLTYRPWVLTVVASAMALTLAVSAVVQTLRAGVSMDSTWGPMMGIAIAALVGTLGSQYWTVTFDSRDRVVRWQVRSLLGVKRGQAAYDEVVGVAFPTTKSSSRSPPRGIALVFADGQSLRLSHYSTVHKAFERLQRIGALIREEVGIDPPGADLAIADAIASAESDIQAIRTARDLLGVPLGEARLIAARIRADR